MAIASDIKSCYEVDKVLELRRFDFCSKHIVPFLESSQKEIVDIGQISLVQ